MACYCCVLGCKNNNHKSTEKHFFRFPKNDVKRSKLWERFSRKNVKQTAVICEDHFEPHYMVQKDKKLSLTNDAVPTIFLRGSDTVSLEFNGDDYIGPEVEALNEANEIFKFQEMIAIETAFVNEQMKLDDLKSRCRFCSELKFELIEMSSFATYNIDIDKFLQSLGLVLTENDFLSNSVCEECFNQILAMDTFVVKCRTADQWLWEEISRLKTVTAVVEQREVEPGQEQNSSETAEGENVREEVPIFSIVYDPSETEQSEFKPKLPEDAIRDPTSNKFAVKSYSCKVCEKTFAGHKTYKNHICDVSEIRCSVCGDIFETAFTLESHRRRLHSEKDGKNYCPICKTVITGNPTAFKKHKTKCNKEKAGSIQCNLCSKTFTTLHRYTIHQMFHESNKKPEEDVLNDDTTKPGKTKKAVICELCGKTYSSVGDCRRHIKLKHMEITEVFSCDTCNKTYPSRSVLKDHIRNTHVVNEVACTYCGKVFRNKTHLKKHMVYHDESKKVHKCLICPEQPGFINKVGLLRHQARHANNDGKHNYNCEICINYNFHSNFQLKSHLKHVHGIDQL